jgi:hypothetical protein
MIAESSSPSVTSLPRSLPEVSTVPGEGHNSPLNRQSMNAGNKKLKLHRSPPIYGRTWRNRLKLFV